MLLNFFFSSVCILSGFPGSTSAKEAVCQCRRLELAPWLRKGENGNPLQYSCWEIPWTEEPGKEVDITESVCTCTHTHTHLICVLSNLKQGLANFIYQSQEVSVLGFTDHMLSVATIQLRQYVDRWAPIKQSTKTGSGPGWGHGCSFQTRDLNEDKECGYQMCREHRTLRDLYYFDWVECWMHIK